MANVDRPRGLEPIGTMSGSPWQATVRWYDVASTYAADLFIGDAVKLNANGTVERAVAGTDNLIGVIVGFPRTGDDDNFLSNDPEILERVYLPANTGGKVAVAVGPTVLYTIQDDASAIPSQSWVGKGTNLVYNAPTNVENWSRSAMEIDASNVGTGSQFIIVDYLREPGNDITAGNAEWIVRISDASYALS